MKNWASCFAVLIAAASAGASARAEEAPVVVGAAIAQSGGLADLAADLRKSLLLWQEQVNAAGGLLGRRVEMRLLDDRSEAAVSGALYERLIRDERADLLIGPFGSAATLGAAAAAERHRRVLVNATGAAGVVQKKNFRYVFHVPAPFAAYGAGVLELARQMNYRRMLILARADPASREMAERLRQDALAAGLAPGEIEHYAPGTTDFSTQIGKARAAQTQAWVAFGLPQDAAEMVKSFRRLAYAPLLFAAQGAADPRFIALVGQDAEHALGITPWGRTFARQEGARFAKAYAQRWSAEPTLVAAEGYAAARVLEEAVKRGGSLEQETLREQLAALEIETPLGRYRVDARGAQIGTKPAVVQIRNGRAEVVWPEALATARWHLPYPRWEERRILR